MRDLRQLLVLCAAIFTVVGLTLFAPAIVAQDDGGDGADPPHVSDAACVDCHADPHEGVVDNTCESCHTTEVWSPTTFDVKRHADTSFALNGKHVDVECGSCHTKGKLKGLPGECAGCHVDKHRGTLGMECETCHTDAGFKPVANFDHSVTGFVADGPHSSAKCEDCHEGTHARSLSLLNTSATCNTCHTPRHGDIGQQCETCHTDSHTSFVDAHTQHTYDHRESGFDLERRHRAIPCRDCHTADGAAPQERCASCHEDPHAGQLTQKCDTCHQPDRWRLVRFDHDQTGHPLQGAHFLASCIDCHSGQRWVGMTGACWDCHAADAARAPKNVSAHSFGRGDCEDCHTNFSW